MENKCRKCGGEGKPSQAFQNTLIEFVSRDSKIGDRGNTLSQSGPAELVDCLKCSSCGHSWIPQKSSRQLI